MELRGVRSVPLQRVKFLLHAESRSKGLCSLLLLLLFSTGESDAIGVFLWASNSDMDRLFPAARYGEPEAGNGSSPLLPGVVHNLEITS